MKLEKAFGLVLRKHRTVEKISQEELSTLTGFDRTFISMLERGKRTPSIRTIFEMAEHLNLKPRDFIDEIDQLVHSDYMED